MTCWRYLTTGSDFPVSQVAFQVALCYLVGVGAAVDPHPTLLAPVAAVGRSDYPIRPVAPAAVDLHPKLAFLPSRHPAAAAGVHPSPHQAPPGHHHPGSILVASYRHC
eukprot:COSAG01_NODE_7599_length_3123_cov_203.193867_1_plen_108_part_00